MQFIKAIEQASWKVIVVACVVIASVAIVICYWARAPYRYVHTSGGRVLDKKTGELFAAPVRAKK